MKKDRILPIFFFSLTLFLVSFIFGYQFMDKKLNPKNISKVNEKEIDTQNYPGLEILKEETRISPNTFVEERIHYKECDHVITRVRAIENEFVNMTKDEFTDYFTENYPDKKIISYSTKRIALGVTKNHLCENHYIIGEENGFIAKFKIGEEGERILVKVYDDYPISLLMEIDQEEIIKGIRVDSEEEFSERLENFIS